MSLESKVRTARHWCVFLRDNKPEFFFTLTFRVALNDQKAEEAMKAFVKIIVSRLPRKTHKSFAGVVLAERTVEGGLFHNTLHFHFVVWGLKQNMTEADVWLKHNVIAASSKLYQRIPSSRCTCREAEIANVRSNCRGGLSCRGRQLSGSRWVHCDEVDVQHEDLLEYMTSDLYNYERPTGGQLLLLGKHGVTGYLEQTD